MPDRMKRVISCGVGPCRVVDYLIGKEIVMNLSLGVARAKFFVTRWLFAVVQ